MEEGGVKWFHSIINILIWFISFTIDKKREAGKARFHLEVKSFKLSAFQDFPFEIRQYGIREKFLFLGAQ